MKPRLGTVMLLAVALWSAAPWAGTAAAGARQDLQDGLTAELMGDNELALALFTRAIESGDLTGRPLAEAYKARADFLGLRGEVAASLADYAQALELDPECEACLYGRAVLRRDSGDCAGAVEDFTRVLELAPDSTLAFLGRSLCRELLGDAQGAAEDRQRTGELALREHRAEAGAGGGVETRTSWEINDEYSQAISHYDQAVRNAPSDPAAYVDRGLAFMNLGRLDQALNDFNRAIELDPDWAAAYYNRGFVWYKLGEAGRAGQDWAKAHALDSRIEIPRI